MAHNSIILLDFVVPSSIMRPYLHSAGTSALNNIISPYTNYPIDNRNQLYQDIAFSDVIMDDMPVRIVFAAHNEIKILPMINRCIRYVLCEMPKDIINLNSIANIYKKYEEGIEDQIILHVVAVEKKLTAIQGEDTNIEIVLCDINAEKYIAISSYKDHDILINSGIVGLMVYSIGSLYCKMNFSFDANCIMNLTLSAQPNNISIFSSIANTIVAHYRTISDCAQFTINQTSDMALSDLFFEEV